MRKEWKFVDVDDEITIPFDWRDPTPGGQNLGRAEFVCCIRWKRGKVSEFWVYPVQSRLDTVWHMTRGNEYGNWHIGSYEKLEAAHAWLVTWCKEHKCQSISIYAPTGAKYLTINPGGIEFWVNDYGKNAK